jgi:hypothetical protein
MLRKSGVTAMTIRSDNASTVCNLQRQGAGLALLKLTRAIFKILTTLDIRLHVVHIPGKKNVLMDSLSRMEITGDYALDMMMFSKAVQLLEVEPTIDLFAHKLNRKLARFVALNGVLAEGAVRTDAFSFSWKGELPYAFPPVQMVGRVLQRVQEEDLQAVVVVPKWPSQPWWSVFREQQIKTVELGQSEQVLHPGLAMTGSHVTLKLPPGVFLMALVKAIPAGNTDGMCF